MSDQQRPSSRVTLEDLLRLKRAERPRAEFWGDFERSLRAKQLAAIVDKRPWWRTLPNFSRWSVPVGAAAALAVTVAVVSHSYKSSPVIAAPAATQTVTLSSQTVAASAPVPVGLAENQSPAAANSSERANVVDTPVNSVVVAASEKSAVNGTAEEFSPAPIVAEAPESSRRLASVSEQIAGLGVAGENEQAAPARYTAVAHRDSEAVQDLNSSFERAVAHLDPAIRSSEKNPSVEPLSQIQTPRDARRARLLAFTSAIDTHSPQYSDNTNVIRSRDRITSHLSEEALYDSIRRLGIKNGGVSIQF